MHELTSCCLDEMQMESRIRQPYYKRGPTTVLLRGTYQQMLILPRLLVWPQEMVGAMNMSMEKCWMSMVLPLPISWWPMLSSALQWGNWYCAELHSCWAQTALGIHPYPSITWWFARSVLGFGRPLTSFRKTCVHWASLMYLYVRSCCLRPCQVSRKFCPVNRRAPADWLRALSILLRLFWNTSRKKLL